MTQTRRQKLVFGNWKMHFTIDQAKNFAKRLSSEKFNPERVEVAVFPASISLDGVEQMLEDCDIELGCQNAYYQDEGAFTGEICMPMLSDVAKYVLVGHSERRILFGETNLDVKEKVRSAFRVGLTPVLCVGETLVERQQGHTDQVLADQVLSGLSMLTADEVAQAIIAYEAVWAISNGKDFANHKAATPEDVERAQAVIRRNISEVYGQEAGKSTRVLYGGSSSKDNAKAFMSIDGIDGLLPGGASLSLETFWPIVEIAEKLTPKTVKVSKKVKS